MGVHAVTTLLDEEVDAKAGMSTIGVVFGKNGTTIFALAIFALALFIFRHSILLVSVLTVTILLQFFYLFSKKQDEKYFRFASGTVVVSFGLISLVYFILQANPSLLS